MAGNSIFSLFGLLPLLLTSSLLVHAKPLTTSDVLTRGLGDESMQFDPRAANYHVAAVDQNSKTVRVFPRNGKWNDDGIFWSFNAGSPSWTPKANWRNLSDVKFRKTGKHGWIALVTASEGNVGIINVTKEKRDNDLRQLMWTGYAGDNPHAIERIPYNGAIVAASSTPGKLTMWVPSDPDDINDYSKLRKSHTYDMDGAHGVLWDPRGSDTVADGRLWALGRRWLVKYKVVGKGLDTKLVQDGSKIEIHGKSLGHDLQPDYTNKDVLLVTDSDGAYAYNTKTNKWTVLQSAKKYKSLVRHPNGEYIWIIGDKNELGQYVRFGSKPGKVDDQRGWEDAKFYKARVYSTPFE
ncbi:hypothetical protein FQN57_002871 [Myotisia sp. PD_48]|nr:hypothetical protein FQN57_002871 [Myotisia sp. PD_48]